MFRRPIAGVGNPSVADATEVLVTTTSQQTVVTYTPTASGNFVAKGIGTYSIAPLFMGGVQGAITLVATAGTANRLSVMGNALLL